MLHEAQLISSRATHLLETGVRIYMHCVRLICEGWISLNPIQVGGQLNKSLQAIKEAKQVDQTEEGHDEGRCHAKKCQDWSWPGLQICLGSKDIQGK